MKRIALFILTLGAATSTFAQPSPRGIPTTVSRTVEQKNEYTVVERGSHHRVWQQSIKETNFTGRVDTRIHSYTEMETGMHREQNGEWVEAAAEIVLTADGAAATNGSHQVYFAANLNTVGAVDLRTPDRKQLRSRILGLSYFDTATGEAVLIAETKDSFGELVYPNQVFYPDAFDDVSADVQYIYKKSGFEQNIVLRAQPLGPAEYGLNPETTRLQVLTEFFDPPTPAKTRFARNGRSLPDENLNFGAMKIVRGRAFSVATDSDKRNSIPVAKEWGNIEGRTFLVEEVPFVRVDADLKALKQTKRQANASPRIRGKGADVLAALRSVLPKNLAMAKSGEVRLAKLETYEKPGFVLDYQISSGATNFTFQSDTTYYCTNTVNLYGETTFEGGAVIKFATNELATINVLDPDLTFATTVYRPVVFTAKNDDSIGEIIAGSTGSPTGFYGGGLTIRGLIFFPPILRLKMRALVI